MFIQDASTPNPHARKFMPGKSVMTDGGTMDFSHVKYTSVSPLARQLFGLEGITRVFYGKDFISITKEENLDWEFMKPEINALITEHYEKGLPLLTEDFQSPDTAINEDDSEVVMLIKELIDTRIRPFV